MDYHLPNLKIVDPKICRVAAILGLQSWIANVRNALENDDIYEAATIQVRCGRLRCARASVAVCLRDRHNADGSRVQHSQELSFQRRMDGPFID